MSPRTTVAENPAVAWLAPGGRFGVRPAVDCEWFFDSIQRADPLQRFPRHRRTMRLLQIIEVTPHVRPTRRVLDANIFIELIESRIGIRLQRTANFSRCCAGCSPLRSGE